MYQKPHLLFTVIVASMLLSGCDSGYIGSESSTPASSELMEVAEEIETKEAPEDTTLVLEAVEEAEEAVKAVKAASETAEAEVSADDPVVQEEALEEPLAADAVDPVYQMALQRLIDVTDLNKEDYSFSFSATEEFIEIETREKVDEIAPLQGIYRYMLDTDEILHSDYLTGEFIPFEN